MNALTFKGFIDLHKAFDNIGLEDVLQILYERHVAKNLIKVVEDIYHDNYVKSWLD